jgi:DNA-binding winged helix-turn-helix (wHTH) protein/tetratricopeptide (TPR) repeat protein
VAADTELRFGAFRIDLIQRALFRDGAPVAMTPRAFDVLACLVSNAGHVVSKDDLMQAVWGKTIVEEGTLNWQVHALRQKLAEGDDSLAYIETVPKRGYRFIAMVKPAAETALTAGTDANAGPSRRRWLGVSVTLVGLAAAAVLWLRPADPVMAYAERDWLLIADFENQTGDPRFDQALLTAFTVSLEQSKFVNVFSRTRVANTLERMRKPPQTRIDAAVGLEICARENIRALVAPMVTRSGKAYAITARLLDPSTGTAVKSYLIPAPNENAILAALDETAARLRRDLGETVVAIGASNRPLAQVTTPVLAALQQYSAGMQFWQQAKTFDAVQRFEAAIAADPEFAMAHAALGRIKYGPEANQPDLGMEYFQRAIALSARATERERMMIVADFAKNRGRTAEALKLYRSYLTAYPSDISIHSRLGDLYADAGRFSEATENYSAALKIDPANLVLLNSMAAALANDGQFPAALDHLQRAIELDGSVLERFNFRFNYGMMLLGSGETQQAREVFLPTADDPGSGHQSQRALGLIEQFSGRYRAAAQHFARAIALSEGDAELDLSRSRNHGLLAATLAAQNDQAGALEQLRLAVISLDHRGPARIEFRARIAKRFARLGDLRAAAAQQQRVLAEADMNNARDRVEVQQLAGELELARGRAVKALALIDEAYQGESQARMPLVLESLGRAAVAAANTARAIEAYRQLVSIKGQWLGWEAQETWLLAHLELARLYRDSGQIPAARQTLDALLTRWRDADKDLPAMVAALQLQNELLVSR